MGLLMATTSALGEGDCCIDELYCISTDADTCTALGGTDYPCSLCGSMAEILPTANTTGAVGKSMSLEFVNGHVDYLGVGSPTHDENRG